ncbi:hypothetical protein ACIBJF_44040 [Streptomyces sp. NPDC050743]|uniref:hypothetical protein n=1 Tax=Streptomyces sp. NPDC050743 TaxID=3365634 RepID=UPI00379F6545
MSPVNPAATSDPGAIAKAMTTPRFAALARADLSVLQIGTWDADLPRDTRLLVPIDVQALVVPAGADTEVVQTETVVPDAPQGSNPQNVLPRPPEPFGASTPREPGVHLHWAMPDGLTRGDAGGVRSDPVPAGNPTSLPALPDRWVVVRLLHGATTVRSWVLEADRGEHHDLAGWTEPGPPDPSATRSAAGRRIVASAQLTAVAGGDPAWAATYDAVLDRFAFHDDLSDLDPAVAAGAELSYLVAGWWSDPALDALHGLTSLGDYHARLDWLQWQGPDPQGLLDDTGIRDVVRDRRALLGLESPAASVGGLVTGTERAASSAVIGHPGAASAAGPAGDAAAPIAGVAATRATEAAQVSLVDRRFIEDGAILQLPRGPEAPHASMLHGSVFGVSLDPAELIDLAPQQAALSIAVGPNGFGALGALLADGTGEQRASDERLLGAFASGLLSSVDAPAGLAAVDEDRHAAGFTALAPGLRERPDRIAEGDVLAGDRAAGQSAPQDTAGASLGSTTKQPPRFAVRLVQKDATVLRSGAVTGRLGTVGTAPRTPRTFRDVAVPLPRAFVPADLALVVGGANRSPRHGLDGRYTPDGRLACRLASQVVTSLRGLLDGGQLPGGLTTVGSGAVPPEVDLLLREVALTDPYRWQEAAGWATAAYGVEGTAVANRLRAEAALRFARTPTGRTADREIDDSVRDPLRRASLLDGVDVSPVGVTRWAQPWVPLWLDWELEIAVDDRLDRWSLGPVDLERPAPATGNSNGGNGSGGGADGTDDGDGTLPPPITIRRRTALAASSARAMAGQITAWLTAEHQRDLVSQGVISADDEQVLASLSAAAGGLDVLTTALAGVRETLLGLDPLDASRVQIAADGTPTNKPSPVGPALLLAGGRARLNRLRVVDAFGRFVDVPDAVLAATEVATALQHPAGAPALRLPPRYQRPARLAFRFVDPQTADGAPEVEARVDQQHAELEISPVAGWLLPDHVDEGLEVFDAAGTSLGQLIHDELTGAVLWEGAPGRPGPAGQPPDPGDDPGARHVTRLAAGCVEADAVARALPQPPQESALSAFLRVVDTTLWTVDPLGSVGTGAVAGLVGRPIAVVRATLRLDVQDDIDALDFGTGDAGAAARAARAQAYADLAVRAVTVRLGELTRSDDGLIAYAVDDDYSALRLVAPEVRSDARASGRLAGQLGVLGRGSQDLPELARITHPWLLGPTDVGARPGQTIRLTLLMTPGGRVHATSGLLPRKALALARDWFHDALVRLSPSFRFGPVLVDPAVVRLPLVTGLGDKQTWTRRDTPLTWRDDPITAATQTAYLPEQPATLQEGWIRVVQEDPGGTA